MSKPLVLSTHPLHHRAEGMILEVAELAIAASLDAATLIDAARDADVIIVRAHLPSSLFENAPRLRAAIRHGAGVDMIPVDAATAAGVLVANVPGANARSVAEHVMFAMLALTRRFRAVDHDLRSSGWNEGRDHATRTGELSGKALGLVGLGNVGREIQELARAFNMRVVAFKPSSRDVPTGVEMLPLDRVFAEADFLVLCCPLTDATVGLVQRARLSLMKRSAFLINVARGAVVVEEDLLWALESGAIAGAALDVFDQQPLPSEHRFFGFGNLLLTPHLAGITDESMERMGVGAVGEALRVLSGELPVNLVNPLAVERYRRRFEPVADGRRATTTP